MKIIFGGPTLHGEDVKGAEGFALHSPARQGDVYRAVTAGANVIGLIDGVYEQVPAVWHKEILYALSAGVRVYGAASMGALRAVECAPFGMIGIGKIYRDLASGAIEDDAEVAQSHAPAELGFLPLSEPLANVRATLVHCCALGLITETEHHELLRAATDIFFKDRTYKSILSAVQAISPSRSRRLLTLFKTNGINQKLIDARELIATVIAAPDARSAPPSGWTFEPTIIWSKLFPVPITQPSAAIER